MITVLKSRRTGEDLRNHPDLNATIAPKVKSGELVISGDRIVRVESFKASQYDRGSKKVYVNGVQWGWISTQWHGCHGTTFHLSDMHGTLHKPYDPPSKTGRMQEIQASGPHKRNARIASIGKSAAEQVAPKTSETIMLEMVRDAIEGGHFIAPDVRNQQIADARARMAESTRQHEAEKDSAFEVRAAEAITAANPATVAGTTEISFTRDELVREIVAAMRWAQSQ